MNGLFLREKLFDYIDVVVAPVLVGGKETASLVDGSSIISENELSELGVLKLIDCTVLVNWKLKFQSFHLKTRT